MAIVIMVYLKKFPGISDSISWGVKFRDHCKNISVNPLLGLGKILLGPTDSVELAFRDVIDIL